MIMGGFCSACVQQGPAASLLCAMGLSLDGRGDKGRRQALKTGQGRDKAARNDQTLAVPNTEGRAEHGVRRKETHCP